MFRHMSKAGCLTAALILSASVCSPCAVAQDVRQVTGNRPAPLDTTAVLSPALEEILQNWEQKSAKVSQTKGEFKRVVYDSTWGVAKCSVGVYYYDHPDKGRMDFTPDKSVVSDPPRTVQRGEVTFKCEADEARVWICDGEQILDVDPSKKEYNRVQIPPQYRGRNISDGPLPFLFGMKADKMKQRYQLELGSLHNPENIIHVIARPLFPAEQQEYRSAEVLLDPVTFLPKAIQLAMPGERQTVYIFTKHDKPTLGFMPGTFKPSLLAFKLINDTTAVVPLERESKKQDGILIR